VGLLKQEAALFEGLRQLRAQWRTRTREKRPQSETSAPAAAKGSLNVTVNGKPHRVDWEVL